jgi:hypothetical protein
MDISLKYKKRFSYVLKNALFFDLTHLLILFEELLRHLNMMIYCKREISYHKLLLFLPLKALAFL